LRLGKKLFHRELSVGSLDSPARPLLNKGMIKTFNAPHGWAQKIEHVLSQAPSKSIIVLGDIGVDEYITGEVKRISPEAPVPVLEAEHQEHRLGLAANVALNLKTLGAEATLISTVGQDDAGQILFPLLQNHGISSSHILVTKERPTTRKTRMMTKHHHLLRVDFEDKTHYSPELTTFLLESLQKNLNTCQAVILQDYGKGLVTPKLMKGLVDLCKQHNKPLYVDPYRTHRAEFYAGCTLIKPNFDETLALLGVDPTELHSGQETPETLGKTLLHRAGCDQVVMTRGKDGMLIFDQDRQPIHVPTYAREVFDVTGAGDTVIATLALGLSSGLKLEEACVMANQAAGIVVGKVGCVPCYREELLSAIKERFCP